MALVILVSELARSRRHDSVTGIFGSSRPCARQFVQGNLYDMCLRRLVSDIAHVVRQPTANYVQGKARASRDQEHDDESEVNAE